MTFYTGKVLIRERYPMEQFTSKIITIGNTDFKLTFLGKDSLINEEWTAEPHLHPFIELHLVNTGKVMIRSGEDKTVLSDNYICIIPANCYHSVVSLSPVVSRMSVYLNIEKNTHGYEDTYPAYKEVFESRLVQSFECKSVYLSEIFKLEKNGAILNSKIEFLISLLLCEIYDVNFSGSSEIYKHNSTDVKTELLLEIEAYLNYVLADGRDYDGTGFSKIAEHLRLSSTQLRRLIKKHFNCTYRDLIFEYKIERAKRIIESTDTPLEKTAEMCGYSTYAGFYKAFIKYTGKTPENYRKDIK